MNPSASLNPPVEEEDLEKGTAGRVVDPGMANAIKASLNIFSVVYVLFFVVIVGLMVMVSDHWWDPWPAVLVLSPIFVATLWLTPTMKGVYIQLYATERPPASGASNNLRTNLLSA